MGKNRARTRRRRRMSSSVLPENMLPQITSICPLRRARLPVCSRNMRMWEACGLGMLQGEAKIGIFAFDR